MYVGTTSDCHYRIRQSDTNGYNKYNADATVYLEASNLEIQLF